MRLAWQSEEHCQFSQIRLVCSRFGNHGFKLKRSCHLCSCIVDIFSELDNEQDPTSLTEASSLCQNAIMNLSFGTECLNSRNHPALIHQILFRDKVCSFTGKTLSVSIPCYYLDLRAIQAIYSQTIVQNTVSGPICLLFHGFLRGSRAVPLSVLHGEALGKKLIPPEEVSFSGGDKFGSRMQSEPCSVIAFHVPVLLGLSSCILRYLHLYPRETKMHIILQQKKNFHKLSNILNFKIF